MAPTAWNHEVARCEAHIWLTTHFGTSGWLTKTPKSSSDSSGAEFRCCFYCCRLPRYGDLRRSRSSDPCVHDGEVRAWATVGSENVAALSKVSRLCHCCGFAGLSLAIDLQFLFSENLILQHNLAVDVALKHPELHGLWEARFSVLQR